MDVDMTEEALREDGLRGEDRRRGGEEEVISRGQMGKEEESEQRMEIEKARVDARGWRDEKSRYVWSERADVH